MNKESAEVSELPVAEPVPSPAPSHVMRAGNPHRSYLSKAYLEEKYSDVPLGDLMLEKSRLEEEVSVLMREESRKFFEAGRGDESIRKRDELASPKPDITGNNDGLIMASQTEVTPAGDLRIFTGKLPWDEYSHVYDAQDEMFWLLREIGRRCKLPSPGS